MDPSARDNYAIRLASENGHKEIVEMLLKDNRVDPKDKGNYAVRVAIKYGHEEIVKMLLQDNRFNLTDLVS